MANPPNWNSKKPQGGPGQIQRQKPKSAAQRASEANQLQQHAIATNSPRPGDRRPTAAPVVQQGDGAHANNPAKNDVVGTPQHQGDRK